jgi:hypothetical protein
MKSASAQVKAVQQAQQQQQRSIGRPRVGSYHLQTILPRYVLDELMNVENETNVYRTRIAADVLCRWAEQQRLSRSQHLSA